VAPSIADFQRGFSRKQTASQRLGYGNFQKVGAAFIGEFGVTGYQAVVNDGFNAAPLESMRGMTANVSCSSHDENGHSHLSETTRLPPQIFRDRLKRD